MFDKRRKVINEMLVIICLQMSDIVGFDLKPQPDTSLFHMLDYGLGKHLAK